MIQLFAWHQILCHFEAFPNILSSLVQCKNIGQVTMFALQSFIYIFLEKNSFTGFQSNVQIILKHILLAVATNFCINKKQMFKRRREIKKKCRGYFDCVVSSGNLRAQSRPIFA
eukprot:TRINITY_DN6027_c0_g2_i1.p4 TRINITY_DN6027_c0_g2~~TRINITY_DN6027_c0_g2_i1.p4  ORF type:complete len:114 (-),score=1.69 TRINITY_DN6027_c0_g2_i1:108-449(-)